MSKGKPTPIGPNENATHRARLDNADTSAAFDASGRRAKEAKEDAATEKPATRAEAIRAAKARITRRSSLQKQREALKG
jgi:hypothetical protein